ncbi:MAG: hypothetical protein SOT80_11035 [Candidatus Pseudoruminococcus sp.]|uniref:hypothetical protein n=1 Tax=Candidatus Pseudoruminococcus sp. TaxID=3101048 RepID=UPI002A790D34|nr:hypothetical protein [Ruminococcus sp.]MDY2783912.1 hypothetical protein [Candidatus Pseudoruminococcus sp.]
MKKLYAVIISILVLCGSVFMSGCSDFEFNPIGKWENVQTIIDGKKFEGILDNDAKICFVFQHNGIAYMTVGGERIKNDYSYTYTDEQVTLTSKDDSSAQLIYSVKDNGSTLELNNGTTVTVFKRV